MNGLFMNNKSGMKTRHNRRVDVCNYNHYEK